MSDLDDPEDAYDADDDIAHLLTNFTRRVRYVADRVRDLTDQDIADRLGRVADDLATLRAMVGWP